MKYNPGSSNSQSKRQQRRLAAQAHNQSLLARAALGVESAMPRPVRHASGLKAMIAMLEDRYDKQVVYARFKAAMAQAAEIAADEGSKP